MTATTKAMRIGEFARRAGMTTKAIRHYEAIDLLPVPERSSNGYRVYHARDLDRVAFIQRAKTLGLSLAEVRELVAVAEHGRCTSTRAELEEILRRKIADCVQRVNDLNAVRVMLEDVARQIRQTRPERDTRCPACSPFSPGCGCVPAPTQPT